MAYTHKRIMELEKQNAELLKALKGMLNVVSDSFGVSGYHMNGDIAEWDEFEEVQQAEQAIKNVE